MKSEWKTFVIIVAVVVVIAAGAVALGKRNGDKTKDSKTSEANQDNGEVAGTSIENPDAGYQERLAKALTEKGAVMYGAYWCSHCNEQKKLFGEAVKYLNYVECDTAGENANPDECLAKDVKSYPTWIYDGKKYPGTRSLAELAALINFSGSASSQDGINSSVEQSNGNSDSAPPAEDGGQAKAVE